MKPKDIEKIRSQIERLKLQNKTDTMFNIFKILDEYYQENPDEFFKDFLGSDVNDLFVTAREVVDVGDEFTESNN